MRLKFSKSMLFVLIAWMVLPAGSVVAAQTAEEYVREALQSINRQDFRDALRKLDEAIDQNDQLAEAHFHRGMLLLQMGNESGALANFDRAAALRPNYGPVYLGKGVIAYRRGRLDEALELLSRSIRLDPSSGVAFYSRGVVYYLQGKLAESEKDLLRALELGSEVDPELLDEVWTLNHLEEVIAETDVKIRINPDDGRAYYDRGIAYYYKKDFFRSLTDLERARALGVEVEDDLLREVRLLAPA